MNRLAYKQGLRAVICGFKLADQPAGELFLDRPDRCGMQVVARRSELEMLPSADIPRRPIPFTRREMTDAVEFRLDGFGARALSAPPAGPEEKALWGGQGAAHGPGGSHGEEAHRALLQRCMESGLRWRPWHGG